MQRSIGKVFYPIGNVEFEEVQRSFIADMLFHFLHYVHYSTLYCSFFNTPFLFDVTRHNFYYLSRITFD